MAITYNIYCDESCHLEKDLSNSMVLGAMWCPQALRKEIYDDIRRIKIAHGLDSRFEIKWTKVSASKARFYLDLINYFFNKNQLSYRCVVATGKKQLNHELFNKGDYGLWYYKMYFCLLDPLISPDNEYRIFIDIKDTKGGPKVAKLKEVLCNNIYDFNQEVITDIRQINSKESDILQLADLLNGAMTYYHRGLYLNGINKGKKNIIDSLFGKHNVNISRTTSRYEPKFNIFIWKPRGVENAIPSN